MASNEKTSLSKTGPIASDEGPSAIDMYDELEQAPRILKLSSRGKRRFPVERLIIQVEDAPDSFVPGFLHLPSDFVSPAPHDHHRTAAILLSGAGGGVAGPSCIYLSIAAKLAALSTGIPALRLDYRYPGRNKYCVEDVKAAMSCLQETYGLDRFVLIGWSFGSAPVFTIGGSDDRITGCAAMASQSAETDGIRRLAPTPVLLLHGTADTTLSPSCSAALYDMYGEMGNRHIHLFENDDHALSHNASTAEGMLLKFVVGCAGLDISNAELNRITSQVLIEEGERTELMKKGGDLRPPESLS
ncbi:hypothetical protein PFICI_14621 [Pestalotiopsis fici W106-1]|uniref:AB hydrolase-1 domain-containing protein n=1 Tax=Pestalotiopsis fici (strain W106-1 / CGMCC3.15140) TaxID=1229662 RepID=W3WIC1_PESFW|nr:uncharacterized protein PFICI_14621 [Pestalotiopsis fici W106-1]ETS73675.1 hypothetical protein PFICI_14621 [Pestalotiopsis fici W106-1]